MSALAIATSTTGVYYAGTSDGTVWYKSPTTASFLNRTSNLPAGVRVNGLTVDPKDSIVRQAVLYDQFQNTVTMTFTKVTVNAGLADSLFIFTPPAGASVVPLEPR